MLKGFTADPEFQKKARPVDPIVEAMAKLEPSMDDIRNGPAEPSFLEIHLTGTNTSHVCPVKGMIGSVPIPERFSSNRRDGDGTRTPCNSA